MVMLFCCDPSAEGRRLGCAQTGGVLCVTTVFHDHPPARFEIVVVIVPPKRNFVAASDRS
jgi:hypothetical protein